MSLFPKKVEYPFKLNQVIVVGFRILCISSYHVNTPQHNMQTSSFCSLMVTKSKSWFYREVFTPTFDLFINILPNSENKQFHLHFRHCGNHRAQTSLNSLQWQVGCSAIPWNMFYRKHVIAQNIRCSRWKKSLISDKQADKNICSLGERLIDTANFQLLWNLELSFHLPILAINSLSFPRCFSLSHTLLGTIWQLPKVVRLRISYCSVT